MAVWYECRTRDRDVVRSNLCHCNASPRSTQLPIPSGSVKRAVSCVSGLYWGNGALMQEQRLIRRPQHLPAIRTYKTEMSTYRLDGRLCHYAMVTSMIRLQFDAYVTTGLLHCGLNK